MKKNTKTTQNDVLALTPDTQAETLDQALAAEDSPLELATVTDWDNLDMTALAGLDDLDGAAFERSTRVRKAAPTFVIKYLTLQPMRFVLYVPTRRNIHHPESPIVNALEAKKVAAFASRALEDFALLDASRVSITPRGTRSPYKNEDVGDCLALPFVVVYLASEGMDAAARDFFLTMDGASMRDRLDMPNLWTPQAPARAASLTRFLQAALNRALQESGTKARTYRAYPLPELAAGFAPKRLENVTLSGNPSITDTLRAYKSGSFAL